MGPVEIIGYVVECEVIAGG